MSRTRQMTLYETLPYSLSRAGPADIDGVGNYYVEVLARGGSDHSALTIYLLDTHSYSPNERKYPGYDWIKPNQIAWFKKTAAGLKHAHSEYSRHHMDIAFIHIPLTEYASPQLPRVGEWKEGVTAPVYNSGFRDALVEQGVVMVSAGQYVSFSPPFSFRLDLPSSTFFYHDVSLGFHTHVCADRSSTATTATTTAFYHLKI